MVGSPLKRFDLTSEKEDRKTKEIELKSKKEKKKVKEIEGDTVLLSDDSPRVQIGPIQKEEARKPFENSAKVSNEEKEK